MTPTEMPIVSLQKQVEANEAKRREQDLEFVSRGWGCRDTVWLTDWLKSGPREDREE